MNLIFRILPILVLCCLPSVAGNGTLLEATQKARHEKLCSSLVAPCCWREPVSVHRSPESLEARGQVAKMIVAGKSDREILDEFVSRYGTRILIEPEGARASWLYLIPIVALMTGIFGAARFLARRRKRILSVEAASSVAPDDSEWDW